MMGKAVRSDELRSLLRTASLPLAYGRFVDFPKTNNAISGQTGLFTPRRIGFNPTR
jgi:hypothetical protein